MEMIAPKSWCQTQVGSLFTQLGILIWASEVCAAQACPGLSCSVPCTHLSTAPRNWAAQGQILQSSRSWTAALWPPEAQGKPVTEREEAMTWEGAQELS